MSIVGIRWEIREVKTSVGFINVAPGLGLVGCIIARPKISAPLTLSSIFFQVFSLLSGIASMGRYEYTECLPPIRSSFRVCAADAAPKTFSKIPSAGVAQEIQVFLFVKLET
jgi:hypothetical protein